MSYGRVRFGAEVAEEIGKYYMRVGNAVFRDSRLTPKAMGVFGHIWSHDHDFVFTVESIAKSMKAGVSAINAALKELEMYGYLVRRRVRNPDGTLGESIYELTDMPDGLRIDIPAPYGPNGSRRSEPTCENLNLDGGRENPRSEPTCDFPRLENPSVENRGLEKNKEQKLPSSLREEGSRASAHPHAPASSAPPVRESSTLSGSGHAAISTQPVGKPGTGKRESVRAAKLRADWTPSEEMLAKAAKQVPGVDLAYETEKFLDRFVGATGTRSSQTLQGWDGTWRNWMRRAWDDLGRPTPASPAPQATLFDEEPAAAPETDSVQAAAAAGVDWWIGECKKRKVPVMEGAVRPSLYRLLVNAFAAGASRQQVAMALMECGEPCPHELRFQRFLKGDAPQFGEEEVVQPGTGLAVVNGGFSGGGGFQRSRSTTDDRVMQALEVAARMQALDEADEAQNGGGR